MLVPKILGISGSLRGAEGNSDKMLREFMAFVERYGGKPEIVRLTDINIITCEGCASKTKDKLAWTFPCVHDGLDDTSELLKKIIECDGLVVASGTYWGDKSSLVQQLFEKMTPLENNRYDILDKFNRDPIEGKHCAVLVSYNSYGASSVAESIDKALACMGFARGPYGVIPQPDILNGKLVRVGLKVLHIPYYDWIQNTMRLIARDMVIRSQLLADHQFDDGEFIEPRCW